MAVRAGLFFLLPAVLLTLSCRRPQWPNIVLSPYFERLLAEEAGLARQHVAYENYDQRERFRPEGMVSDGKDIFIWSSRHREQAVLSEKAGQWQIARRLGPLKTQRCLFIREHNIGSVCIGAMQMKGLTSFDSPIHFELENRAGYVDFAYAGGNFFVADSVGEQIIILNATGKAVATKKTPGIYRIFTVGMSIIYLSHLNPRLVVLAETGSEWKQTAAIQLDAPVRDLWFDDKAGLVWTVGPKNEIVRRKNGGIDNLNSFLYAYKAAEIFSGNATPLQAIDLGRHGLVDALSLTPSAQGLLVSARGSARFAQVTADGGVRVINTGLQGVSALLAHGQKIFAAGMFSDAVKIFDAAGNPLAHLKLNAKEPAPLTPADKGELIFYSRSIGRDIPENQFSCESCHWDRLGDHRIHYGGGGTQGLIRAPRGIGMVHRPFPDMEYDSIAKLVEEFFKAMDYEFWSKPALDEAHWQNEKIIFPESSAPIRLSARDARSSLLGYLMRLPVERPVLRAAGEAITGEALKGFDLFWRDCVRCHEAVTNMRDRQPLNRSQVLSHLKDKPLLFGAPFFVKTGLATQYTTNGTRTNPLLNLGRGGPFLSRGSAKNLGEVLRRTNPNTREIHFDDDRKTFYTADEIRALTAFLLSI